jgi:hypothetical protein
VCLPPQSLPDALRGEKWAFVQLPLSNLREMLKPVGTVSLHFRGGVFLGGGEHNRGVGGSRVGGEGVEAQPLSWRVQMGGCLQEPHKRETQAPGHSESAGCTLGGGGFGGRACEHLRGRGEG